ncbi:hypothetical protein HHK36_010778 [Tetracentron sinense]|uniref:Uncharacterized protein n=1 Tax=Tetracentron sinense TaxID=13715 RepID=A0A834ZB43_TETSI|nr:hypothetical protein HHK36_010778 [Tetracentron sinense]
MSNQLVRLIGLTRIYLSDCLDFSEEKHPVEDIQIPTARVTVEQLRNLLDSALERSPNKCSSVGIQGIAWSFGGMIFALVYCTAGISGGHINPAVTFGLLLARKLSLTRAVFYMVMQCLGAICGAGVVKGFQKTQYQMLGGGANVVAHGYTKGDGLGAEIVGTFVLVYTVFSATDAKRSARDSHVPILAPLPIGFAVFLVHLATIPITGTGINPARSLGAAIIYNKDHAWNDHVMDFLGRTFHWGSTCGRVPPDRDQSHSIQIQGMMMTIHFFMAFDSSLITRSRGVFPSIRLSMLGLFFLISLL